MPHIAVLHNKKKKVAKIQHGKPIDRWLAVASLAAGLITFLLNRTPLVIVCALIIIFSLLVHPAWNFWWIERRQWRRVIAVVCLASALAGLGYAIWPQPTFLFIFPTVWMKSGAMELEVEHRGPDTLFKVGVSIDDQDRGRALANSRMVTIDEIGAAHRDVKFEEASPKGRGSLEPEILWWTPLPNSKSVHFIIGITHRAGNLNEDLWVLRVGDGWVYAMRLINTDSGKTVIECRDKLFPAIGWYTKVNRRCIPDMIKRE